METVNLVPIEANGVTVEGVSVNIPGTELEILQVRCARDAVLRHLRQDRTGKA